MTKIAYEDRSITPAGLDLVDVINGILTDYAGQGYQIGLRALYYQLVARDLFPAGRRFRIPGTDEFTANVQKNYKWLGDLLTDARIAGLVDWDHLVDETREARVRDRWWAGPEDFLAQVMSQYKIPRWDGQGEYVEVWVEKAALGPIVRQAAGEWDVTTFECKGSPSTSAVWDAAQRLRRHERAGKKTTVIYLGDHDPTGIDISRDITDRLALFRSTAAVDRIALNMDQVIALDPPPSPVKVTDSRASGYIDTFGTDECWELDAIDPPAMDAMIQDAIRGHVDLEMRQARLDREAGERSWLEAVHDNWPDLLAWMRDENMLPAEPGDEDGGEE
jgi:hypothetical protein